MTSSAYVEDLKGNPFGCTICPSSFVVIASIFSELSGWGRISPLPDPEDQKKPDLNRVNHNKKFKTLRKTTQVTGTLHLLAT